jgi:uncharacterized protein YrrD
MSTILRAADLIGLPVVTITGGDDVAEVRDVVFDPERHRLTGFTLNRRGRLRGRLRAVLPVESTYAIGRDAVMVEHRESLEAPDAGPEDLADPPTNREVLGAPVITEDGVALGVLKAVLLTAGRTFQVVGYRVDPEKGDEGAVRYLPAAARVALSGDTLVVPSAVTPLICDDAAGLTSAMEGVRRAMGDQG